MTHADKVLAFENKGFLGQAVNALFNCGHAHNFKVELDGRNLITTELGVNCVTQALFPGKRVPFPPIKVNSEVISTQPLTQKPR